MPVDDQVREAFAEKVGSIDQEFISVASEPVAPNWVQLKKISFWWNYSLKSKIYSCLSSMVCLMFKGI